MKVVQFLLLNKFALCSNQRFLLHFQILGWGKGVEISCNTGRPLSVWAWVQLFVGEYYLRIVCDFVVLPCLCHFFRRPQLRLLDADDLSAFFDSFENAVR
jgi:hypothetical protein